MCCQDISRRIQQHCLNFGRARDVLRYDKAGLPAKIGRFPRLLRQQTAVRRHQRHQHRLLRLPFRQSGHRQLITHKNQFIHLGCGDIDFRRHRRRRDPAAGPASCFCRGGRHGRTAARSVNVQRRRQRGGCGRRQLGYRHQRWRCPLCLAAGRQPNHYAYQKKCDFSFHNFCPVWQSCRVAGNLPLCRLAALLPFAILVLYELLCQQTGERLQSFVLL